MTEEVDIIDEDDEVIGQEPKEEAIDEGLLHRAVHVLIFDSDGYIVSQLRKEGLKVAPHKWTSSVREHVKAGEDPHQAAERGALEELNIDTELEFVGKFDNEWEEDREIVYVYVGEHPGPFEIGREAEELHAYPLDYLMENPDGLEIDPNFRKTLEYFVEEDFSMSS